MLNILEKNEFDLTNMMNMGNFFNPFATAIEDTLDLMDIVCMERVEKHRLEVTFMLSNEVSFQFHTLFTGITEYTLELAIQELFEFISHDIDKLEVLADIGLLGELLSRFQLKVLKTSTFRIV